MIKLTLEGGSVKQFEEIFKNHHKHFPFFLIEYVLSARHCAKCFRVIISCSPLYSPKKQVK